MGNKNNFLESLKKSYRPLFAKFNILNVNDMCSLELGVFMYKYSINDLPNAFNDYFTKRPDINGCKTRHVNDLNLTKNKKHFSDHSVRTTGPILWNSIDKKLTNSTTVKGCRMGRSDKVSLWYVSIINQH